MPRPPTTHEWKETRSAFGGGVERLMQFDLRRCDQWYMKFALFSSPVDPRKLPEYIRGPGFGNRPIRTQRVQVVFLDVFVRDPYGHHSTVLSIHR
jgi:hypothetical protein